MEITRTARWWVMTLLALGIAGYAITLAFVGESMHPPPLRESFNARPGGIFFHALASAVALVIGPFQLNRSVTIRRRRLHRNLGKVYIAAAALGAGATGFYMALYAHGGAVTRIGFGTLAILTLATTMMAYLRIRRRQVPEHRVWMIRSYALLFAAVTLRIELPLLIAAHAGAFTPAYQVVSWLCWVPNLLWAEWYIRRTRYAPGASIAFAEALPQRSGS